MTRVATVHLSIKHTRRRHARWIPTLMSLGGRGKFGPFPFLSMNFFKSVLRYSNTCRRVASGSAGHEYMSVSKMEASVSRIARTMTTVVRHSPSTTQASCSLLHAAHKATCTADAFALRFILQKEKYSASAQESRTVKLQFVQRLLDDVVAFIQHLKQRNLSERC